MGDSRLGTFWSELRRRKVVRVAVVYVLVAWLLIQVAEVTFEPLQLPEWALTLVIAMLMLGFPVALVLAWALDLSPDGIQREKSLAELHAQAPGVTTPDVTTPALPTDRHSHSGQRAIAVLPLTNMSGDPENEFFSDGITEEILNQLARQPGLRVVSRTSSFSFKNTTLDVPAIADKLGVDIVLEGSVRRAGNRVRIIAQLIDAGTDAHLWSNSYDRELEDIFAVQIEIAKCIVDAMNLDPDTCIECGGNTEVLEAYDYYLQGRQSLQQHSVKGLGLARQMFQKAIDADPLFARAYAGLATAETVLAQWIDHSELHLARAEEASRKALELEPGLAEAHASRAYALSSHGHYDQAAEEFDKALALDPLHYDSLNLYARTRFAEGKLADAAELWQRAHEAQPDEFQSATLRVQALQGLGREADADRANQIAMAAIDRRLAIDPDDLRALTLGACVAHNAGRPEAGKEMIARALELAPTDGGVLHNVSCYYSNIGEVDLAIETLERRLQVAGHLHRDWIQHDSDFDNIRDDPRFKALLESLPQRVRSSEA